MNTPANTPAQNDLSVGKQFGAVFLVVVGVCMIMLSLMIGGSSDGLNYMSENAQGAVKGIGFGVTVAGILIGTVV